MELTFAGVVGVEDLFSSSDVDGRLSLRELSVRENMKMTIKILKSDAALRWNIND